MLNQDSLSQLAQLKQNIEAAKDYGTGKVVGSNGRFGFVKLEDGRDVYLSPELMQHLIPGDEIKVVVETNSKDKLEAKLEKLLTPALSRFVGQYRIKGKAHFVQPSGAQSARWIFVPPKLRDKNCQDGDAVIAKLTVHPFRDGKANAKILEKIGQQSDPRFEHKYVLAKYQLSPRDAKPEHEHIQGIEKRVNEEDFGDRPDLSSIPFVTIDGVNTKDMDDAIAMEVLENGTMRLHVAIADPSYFISQSSPLAKRALTQAASAYLIGGAVPMLPTSVSHHCFSLEEQKIRPALVCHIDIDSDGNVQDTRFEFAQIKSHHKLAYENVGQFLEGDTAAVPEDCHAMLGDLKRFADVRRGYRETHFLVPADQDDYDYQLDELGHIAAITLRPRSAAHQIVEEAMLVTNLSAATLLAQHKLGLCSGHSGFRDERLGEVKALLKEENITHGDLQQLADHVQLFKTLEQEEKTAKLIGPLRRMMEAAELSLDSQPHLGMGVSAYTTITSPIRRFADLYNHWALRKILNNESFTPLNEQQRTQLNERLQTNRQADRELSLWLLTLFTESLIGQEKTGKIRIVTQHGFGVRLDENGIEGFVLFPKTMEKEFDAKRMTLKVDSVNYEIGQTVNVKVASVDKDKRRVALEVITKAVTEEEA